MSATIHIPVPFTYDPAPLRAAAAAQNITNRQLAAETGLHEVTISRYMQGKPVDGKNPFVPKWVDWLCERLGVDKSLVVKSRPPESFLPTD